MLEHNEMKKVIRSTRDDGQKSWNFPKFAMLSHVFDGICGKGVIMNYCTKNIYLFPNLLLISHAVYFPCPLVFFLLRLGTIIHDDPFATDPMKYMTQHCKLGKIP